MYIYELGLKNIGPFIDEKIKFIENESELNTITIITGQNGSGKSIVLDAIRGMLTGFYSNNILSRPIVSDPNNFGLSLTLDYGFGIKKLDSKSFSAADKLSFDTDGDHNLHVHIYNKLQFEKRWIIDYWTSQISDDKFVLDSITKLDTTTFLKDGIIGKQNNLNVVKLITFFDYLSGSGDDNESELGKIMFSLIKDLINESLNYGTFSHISRTTLQPVLKVRGHDLTIDKLSSGNLYLIQRLLSLVYKSYSVYKLYGGDVNEINNVKGLLLIDEIENHLHPKWQKRILKIIRKYFPNLQIILTTHSPFIVSSMDDVNVFVCEMGENSATISNQTDVYKYKPIEEIIRTPLFYTDSFNEEISQLLKQRKISLEEGDDKTTKEIEAVLISKNPEYFRYLKIDDV